MIRLVRVDDRLLHGQVSFYWTEYLNLSEIIIVNNEASEDDFTKMILDLAKPKDVKLTIVPIDNCKSILNQALKSMDNIIVIVSNLIDAKIIFDSFSLLKICNLGGLRNRPGAIQVSEYLYLTCEDTAVIRELMQREIEMQICKSPYDTRINIREYI